MKSLQNIYKNYCDLNDNGGGDKGTVHSYIDLYHEYFSDKRNSPVSLLEIGVFKGHSLAMWADYFPENSIIVGVDIANRLEFPEKGFRCVFGNVLNDTETRTFNSISNINYDIIIDDGSHILYEQIETFKKLKPLLKSEGLYIIEDIDKIDNTKIYFEELGFKIYDLRYNKNRYDDVLAVYINK